MFVFSSGRNHFVCKNCNLVFLGPSYLHRHKEHRCPMLSESSPLQTEDNTHVESIADNKARASERSVNTETTFAASSSKEYQCSQCDMSFKTSKLLLKHYRLHTDDFPYKCWTSGEGFRDKYSKLKHMHRETQRKVEMLRLRKEVQSQVSFSSSCMSWRWEQGTQSV